MLTKSDCLSILVRLESAGIEIDSYMKKLLGSNEIPMEVIQFIASQNGLEAGNFYEMLRQKHNKNKSPLYTNILKETQTVSDAITTLTCLLTQVVLYSNKLDYKESFLKEVRAEEITRALNNYFKSFDAAECLALLKLIKADITVIEYMKGRRNLV